MKGSAQARSLGSGMVRAGLFILLAAACWLVFLLCSPVQEAYALPEYSAQTGEPCASCHLSPSGGGARGPRGQAWVGSGKPGQIPDLAASLEILGVELEVDEALYSVAPETIPPAGPLSLDPETVDGLHEWLREYEGN